MSLRKGERTFFEETSQLMSSKLRSCSVAYFFAASMTAFFSSSLRRFQERVSIGVAKVRRLFTAGGAGGGCAGSPELPEALRQRRLVPALGVSAALGAQRSLVSVCVVAVCVAAGAAFASFVFGLLGGGCSESEDVQLCGEKAGIRGDHYLRQRRERGAGK